jgi:hypothetical protein
MDTITNFPTRTDDFRKKIVQTAIAIIGLMILFPPKVIVQKNPILDQTMTQSAGYQFILSDPAGEQKAAAKAILGDKVDEFVGSSIEWSRLLIQFAIVGGAAFMALRFVEKPKAY